MTFDSTLADNLRVGRPDASEAADELVLDHGRLVQRGRAEELVELDGLFARAWRHQRQDNRHLVAPVP